MIRCKGKEPILTRDDTYEIKIHVMVLIISLIQDLWDRRWKDKELAKLDKDWDFFLSLRA